MRNHALNIFLQLTSRFLVVSCFVMISKVLVAQVSPDLGQLEIQNFSPKEYNSHPQNWAITQGKNGLMYFGNNFGVLVYDGVGWQLVRTLNESTVRSLDVSPDGKVFVGASADFGYLRANKNGLYEYVSLRKLFNLDEEKVGNVFHVNAFDYGVYFMSKRRIFFYNGHTLRVWESDENYQSAFKIYADYVVNKESKGLYQALEDSLIKTAGVHDFSQDKLIDFMEYSPDDPLVLTMRKGIKRYSKMKSASRIREDFLEKVNSRIIGMNPDNFARVKNNMISIGTWGNGLVFVDKEGDLVHRLKSTNGLIDDVITDQYIDRNGNLWLATSNGISRIGMERNLATFREKANVNETVEKICRFQDRLFIASHTGLYSWEEKEKSGSFEKVAHLATECWDILPVNIEGRSLLLVAGNNAIYQLDENHRLEKVVTCLPWTFHQLQSDPKTILVGLDDGLMALNYDGGTWVVESNVAGIDQTIYAIDQSENKKIWLGTLHNGLIRLKVQGKRTSNFYFFESRRFGKEEGLPEGGVFPCNYVGGMIFGSSDGLYSYNDKTGEFYEEKIYKEIIGMDQFIVHRISEDDMGRLWMSAYWEDQFVTGYYERNGTRPTWKGSPLKAISREVFHSIYHDAEGMTWLGGPDGLFRYNPEGQVEDEYSNFTTLIRSVALNKDSMEFSGNLYAKNYNDTISSTLDKKVYPYDFNSVTLVYSSQFYKHPELNLYSHQLIGFDNEWSEWTHDIKAVYTNLYEGDYTFRVKSKNIYGNESEISEFSFTIQPPWYRTWWAYIIYGLLSTAFVWVVVVVYTKKLKEIIKDRTKEVVEQKEKIEKQKDEVEAQRKLLEIKNADITSSINYAKRLQEALLPKDDFIEKHLKEHFILYKPKDIVSGDFYWMEHLNGIPGRDITLFATVDCTGHGVPGAFVSVVGNGGLNRAVNEFGLVRPAEILEKLNEIVVNTLSKGEDELRDGMDISLCMFDMHNMEMQFSGANNSVYILRKDIESQETGLNGNARFFKNDLCEIKANKQPIGYYEFHKSFNNNSIKIQKGDVVYLFSDGFTDQFGGPNCKKYNVTRFRKFLLEIYQEPMSEQRKLVEKEFESWKGDEDQIDDVIVAGIRI